jgi:hypothetical protein
MEATVVSLMPCAIVEKKPGLIPDTYFLPKAEKGDFQSIVVTDTRFPVYIDNDRGTMWIPALGETVAESIVRDYSNAQLGIEDGAKPGLFWIPGEHTKSNISKNHQAELSAGKDMQTRWFKRLVRLADDDWNRFHQHRMISDIQRYAAEFLGSDREWLSIDMQSLDVVRCPACSIVLQNPHAAICINCRCVLNRAAYEKLTFAGAVSVPSGNSIVEELEIE